MTTGGPGLPQQFTWCGKSLVIKSVLRTWRELGSCKTHGADQYVRKHWFEVQTATGQRARIYFDRQPRSRNKTARWTLFTIEDLEEGR